MWFWKRCQAESYDTGRPVTWPSPQCPNPPVQLWVWRWALFLSPPVHKCIWLICISFCLSACDLAKIQTINFGSQVHVLRCRSMQELPSNWDKWHAMTLMTLAGGLTLTSSCLIFTTSSTLNIFDQSLEMQLWRFLEIPVHWFHALKMDHKMPKVKDAGNFMSC